MKPCAVVGVGTMHPARPTYLDVESAAEYLGGLKRATLDRWRTVGGGPVFYKLGGRVMYRLEDLEDFVRARRRTSTSDPGPGGTSEVG
ncbi:MAG TPA: helix-turn-helix domain-containing protein [Thermoanaerobaculia bacterium]|nr:helix-turn-helix domain-containing protein [Thermoanaerobaculia bacterium]